MNNLDEFKKWVEEHLKLLGDKEDPIKFLLLVTIAISQRRMDVMGLLIEKGLEVNNRIIKLAMTDVLDFLVKIGYKSKLNDIIVSNGPEGDMLIHFAAGLGYIEAVDWLLRNDVGIETPNKRGETPMHKAAMIGNVEMIRHLKKRGADIYARDKSEACLSPMENAIMFDRIESIKCLKELGANINTRDGNGRTPIFKAVMFNKIKSIRCLAGLGANMDAGDNNGTTPMFWAAMCGNIEGIRCLKELGANVNAGDNLDATPIFGAALNGKFECMKCLADELGANISLKANNGMTLVDAAKLSDSEIKDKIVEWLRAKGVT